MRLVWNRHHLLAWLMVLTVTVFAGKTPPIADQPDWAGLGVSLSEGRAYRTDGSRRPTLDVYRPSTASSDSMPERRRPALLFIHGGSWIGGSINALRHDPRTAAIRLAREGMVVLAIDYRLARPGWPSWPAAVGDLREAVRWVRRHADELGIDPDRIAAMGESAGGHLAGLLGALPDERGDDGVSSRVQAVVSFYAPSDLPRLMETRRLPHEPARVFLGDAVSGRDDAATEASPIAYVTPDDPPVLLVHGSDDAWVPLEQSVRLAEALDRAGVRNRLIILDGARHGFGTLVETPPRDLVPDILAFLNRVWNGRT